jgi:hypothetical protein
MYMKEMLQERKGSQHTDHHDLFSSLLASNIPDSKIENLADDEIFGAYLSMVTHLQADSSCSQEICSSFSSPGMRYGL